MGRCFFGEFYCVVWLGLGLVIVLGVGFRVSGFLFLFFCFGSCFFRIIISSDYDIRFFEERRDVGFYRVVV